MKRKILLTGASGLLGGALFDALQKGIFGQSHTIYAPDRIQLDLSEDRSICQYVKSIDPDVIIHCGGYTNVDKAENDVTECYKINTLSVSSLLKYIRSSVKFVFISSTGIYGAANLDKPYTELDIPNPTTIYHKSKLSAEVNLRYFHSNHLIFRTGWLYGGSDNSPRNFVINRIKEAKVCLLEGKSIIADPFQKGNPTSVFDLSLQVIKCLETDIQGTINAVNTGSASRYEYVQYILNESGIKCEIEAAEQPFARVAKVSANESADNLHLDACGLSIMRPWQQALSSYIFSLGA